MQLPGAVKSWKLGAGSSNTAFVLAIVCMGMGVTTLPTPAQTEAFLEGFKGSPTKATPAMMARRKIELGLSGIEDAWSFVWL